MPRENRLFFKDLGDRIQDRQYVCQQSAEIVAILVVIVASGMEEAVPSHRSRNNALTTKLRLAGRSPSRRMK
jgi:hypothetical protein